MKLTFSRKTVLNWAGAQIVRDAETLLENGLLLEAEFEEPFIKGAVLHNNRRFETCLEILPDGSAENHCRCYANKERGLICHHVVAIALSIVKRRTDPMREAKYREEKRQPPGVELLHWFDSRMRRDQDDSQLGIDLSQENWESSDYGGGGWLTTAGDLVKFLRGASGNTLFRDPNSWQLMQEWSDDSWIAASSDHACKYGLGLMRLPLPGGGALVGHTGYYGSFAFLWPERDVVMVGTFNQGMRCSPAGDTSCWHFLREVHSAVSEVLVP